MEVEYCDSNCDIYQQYSNNIVPVQGIVIYGMKSANTVSWSAGDSKPANENMVPTDIDGIHTVWVKMGQNRTPVLPPGC